MTTLVWNGKMLAADSRRVHGNHHDDTISKIIRVDNTMYKDEKILLMAGCGTVRIFDAFYGIFLKDPENFSIYYKHASRTGLTERSSRLSATVLIITDKSTYTCRITSDSIPDLVRWSVNPDQPLIMGSGAKHAEALVKLFNVSPEMAVAGASIIDLQGGTGGTVNFVEVDMGAVVYEGSVTFRSTNAVMDVLKNHMRSENARYLGGDISMITRTIKGKKKEVTKEADSAAPMETPSCIAPNHLVLMNDGSHKRVCDLVKGDVLAWSATPLAPRVELPSKPRSESLLKAYPGSKPTTLVELTDGTVKAIRDLKEGDCIRYVDVKKPRSSTRKKTKK